MSVPIFKHTCSICGYSEVLEHPKCVKKSMPCSKCGEYTNREELLQKELILDIQNSQRY